MRGPTLRLHTGGMRNRSSSTVAWSFAIGVCGALAIGASGVVLTLMVDLVASALDVVGHGPSTPTSSHDIQVVTATSMLLCLGIAGGGGWTLAGAPEGLTPRWLAGAVAGLVGVGAGGAVFAVALGLAPI